MNQNKPIKLKKIKSKKNQSFFFEGTPYRPVTDADINKVNRTVENMDTGERKLLENKVKGLRIAFNVIASDVCCPKARTSSR